MIVLKLKFASICSMTRPSVPGAGLVRCTKEITLNCASLSPSKVNKLVPMFMPETLQAPCRFGICGGSCNSLAAWLSKGQKADLATTHVLVTASVPEMMLVILVLRSS